MIDDKQKFIFIENPKSASSAVKRALTGQKFHSPYDPRTATINHHTADMIKQQQPEKWQSW